MLKSALAVQNPPFETHNALDHSYDGLYNLGPIPSWVTTGTSGSWQPNSSAFTALSDGSIVAYNDTGTIAQTLTGVLLQPSSTYTLTVAIGHRSDGYATGYIIALQAGSTVLNSVSGSNSSISSGTFADQTLTYTTGTSVTSGDLGIVLTSNGAQIDFDNVRLSVSGNGDTISCYFSDHLGTARVVTNATGTVLDDSDFYPFGGERIVSAASGNHYKFTGKERDSESGLDNFGARYDSSQYGRFMTPDWSEWSDPVPYADLDDPQTLNLYAYVRNNPLAFADRDGHDHCSGADGRDPDSCTANKGTWVIGNEPKQQPQQSNADDQKIRDFASQINQRNILANTAKIYGASAVVGLTGGTVCYYLCPEAATVSLAGETGTDLIEGTNTLNKVIGGEQRELLKDFFKTGERPNGLSDRTLKIYKDIAQRAIDAKKDGLGVQADRVKMIINALK